MLKIYAGNLPSDTSEKELAELFAAHGRVRSIKLALDVFSGKCRGFGFVEMDVSDLAEVISALNGREIDGRQIRVNEAEDKRDSRGSRGSGGANRRY